MAETEVKSINGRPIADTTARGEIAGKAPKAGWGANKYLGADAAGNIVEKEAPQTGGITQETDPTVPAWAKQPEKPAYTAEEVGALPSSTKIPTAVSELNNDTGFITKAVSDLVNYYTKSQTYTQEEIRALVSAIPKFSISVVDSLPTSGISGTTIYLVKSGSGTDLYTEYIYTNGAWEILGSQRVDLTGYATETWVNARLTDFVTAAKITELLGYTPANQADVDKISKDIDELPNNETLIDNVAEVVKDEVPLVKVAEQPDVVDSVDEMTDTSKVYVLSSDGYFYKYVKVENYNLFKLSEVSYASRLQDSAEEIIPSNAQNAVTGWFPVTYGNYYAMSFLFDGIRTYTRTYITRVQLKLSDGSIKFYATQIYPNTGASDNKILAVDDKNAVEMRLHFKIYDSSITSTIDINTPEILGGYKPMIIEGATEAEAGENSVNFEYIDGDEEAVKGWRKTGMVYNQPADYEDRILELESEVSKLKAGTVTSAEASPYYRDVNWGCVPNEYFRGLCDSYSSEGFANETRYDDYIEKFKALIVGHEAYVTETELGAASDGQSIYMYDFKPVRWDNETINIPKIIIVAGQHGWEKCNVFGLYYFVKDLLNNWFGSTSLEYLRHHVELMIVPVVNTYGFDNFQYKNANGVNINRNYDANWVLLEDTTSQQYGGAEPFDQPESQLIRNLVLGNSDCVLLIDSHTNSTTNTVSWDKLGYYGICNRTDTYFNRIRNALPELVSKISPMFNVDYNLGAPNTMFGFMTTSEGNGILRTWACDNNITSVLIEGFAGFLEGEPVSHDIYKANEEQIVNWLITAMYYLSK